MDFPRPQGVGCQGGGGVVWTYHPSGAIIQVMMDAQPKLRRLFSRGEIEAAVDRLAADITHEYRGENPLFIGILKGSFVFLADLVRRLDFPLEET